MNEIIKAMLERRSIRKYKKEMPEKALVDQVVEAGLWAASGAGLQYTRLIVVRDPKLRDELSRLNRQVGGWGEEYEPYYGAPMLIAVLDKKGTGHCVNDGSLALGNMMLAAHAVGLGSCWIHRAKEVFEMEEGRQLLEKLGMNPDEWVGVGNLALGYPDGDAPKAAPRKEDRVFVLE